MAALRAGPQGGGHPCAVLAVPAGREVQGELSLLAVMGGAGCGISAGGR